MKQTFIRKSKIQDIPAIAVIFFVTLLLSSGPFVFESVIVRVGAVAVTVLTVAYVIRHSFNRYHNWWTEIDLSRDGITVHYPRQNIFFQLPDSIKRFNVSYGILEFNLEYGEQKFRLLPADFLKEAELIAALDNVLDLKQFATDGTTYSAEFANVITEANHPENFSPRVAVIIIVGTIVLFTALFLEMVNPLLAITIWIIGLIVGIPIGVRRSGKKWFGIIKKGGKPQKNG